MARFGTVPNPFRRPPALFRGAAHSIRYTWRNSAYAAGWGFALVLWFVALSLFGAALVHPDGALVPYDLAVFVLTLDFPMGTLALLLLPLAFVGRIRRANAMATVGTLVLQRDGLLRLDTGVKLRALRVTRWSETYDSPRFVRIIARTLSRVPEPVEIELGPYADRVEAKCVEARLSETVAA